MKKRFLLVNADALPEVFHQVLRAKKLLASGEVRNVSAAAREVGISRSAFYKYRDCIFEADANREVATVVATLLDETGALQSLLAGISNAGASIVILNQSRPENGTAQIAVTIRTNGLKMSLQELVATLAEQRTVVDVRCDD